MCNSFTKKNDKRNSKKKRRKHRQRMSLLNKNQVNIKKRRKMANPWHGFLFLHPIDAQLGNVFKVRDRCELRESVITILAKYSKCSGSLGDRH